MDNDDRVRALQTIVRTGGKPMTRCPECNEKYLFIGKGRPKKYCSSKCRKRAGRKAHVSAQSAEI